MNQFQSDLSRETRRKSRMEMISSILSREVILEATLLACIQDLEEKTGIECVIYREILQAKSVLPYPTQEDQDLIPKYTKDEYIKYLESHVPSCYPRYETTN